MYSLPEAVQNQHFIPLRTPKLNNLTKNKKTQYSQTTIYQLIKSIYEIFKNSIYFVFLSSLFFFIFFIF